MENHLIAERDYPLYEKRPEWIQTPTGLGVNDITIENVLDGKVTPADCRISARTLLYQAQIAESVGSFQIAANFRRAAELTRLPDARILEIYNSMRPHNSTEQELLAIADELERAYDARLNADLLREAAEVYKDRDMLRK